MAALLGGLPLALGSGHRRRSCAGRSASPSSAACSSRRCSRSTRRRSSTSTWTRSRALVLRSRRAARRAGAEGAGVMNISAPFIRRPIATSLLAAAHPAGGRRRLHAAARSRRCRASTSRPSHVSAALPGASPETMAVRGGDAARAPLRPHRRRHRDDLDELARHRPASRCSSISTATSTPPRATCRRRSTPPAASCPPTCRRGPTTARSTRPTRRS